MPREILQRWQQEWQGSRKASHGSSRIFLYFFFLIVSGLSVKIRVNPWPRS
jgi:hypothetical protein